MRRISALMAEVGGAAILLCALLIGGDIVSRSLTGSAPLRSFEISTYVFAVVTAIGFSYALIERLHIRIEILYQRLSQGARAVCDVLNVLLLALGAGALAWQGTLVAYDSWEVGAVSKTTLQLPLIIPQALWAAALLWFAVVAFILLARNLVRLARRDVRRIEADIGIGTPGLDQAKDPA